MRAVRLDRMIRNAPNVVRKMYQPMDPIIHVHPPLAVGSFQPAEPRIGPQPLPLTSTANADSLDSSTKWPSEGTWVEIHWY
jgi:hypothetical protein